MFLSINEEHYQRLKRKKIECGLLQILLGALRMKLNYDYQEADD